MHNSQYPPRATLGSTGPPYSAIQGIFRPVAFRDDGSLYNVHYTHNSYKHFLPRAIVDVSG